MEPAVQLGETLLLVEAEGRETVTPDRMRMTIGVVTTGGTAAEALDANNRRMSAVIAALESFAVDKAGIQTTDFSVEPQFSDDRGASESRAILGYKAQNTVSVETRELDKAGAMIASAFEAGANSVDGPFFDVGDVEAEATIRRVERLALANARGQAVNMAGALGLRVSRILRVSDRDIDFPRSYSKGGGLIVVTGSRIAATPIVPGEIPVTVEVFVEFALDEP